MVIDELNKYSIILGSKSPRRQELLRELGLEFKVVTKDWDEYYPPFLTGAEIALHVSGEKAKSFLKGLKTNEIVITADTIVWCENEVLPKPADREDAFGIIRKISGRTHEVITGVCLLSCVKSVSFYSSTRVTFSELSDEEIVHYIRKYKPYDKAGAYGIQEWIGIAACSAIEGSYFNVVGLPVEQVYRELKKFVL